MDDNPEKLPVHSYDGTTAPATLVAAAGARSGGGPVRVWSPDKWRHWLYAALSPFTLIPAFFGLMLAAVAFHVPGHIVRPLLVVWLLYCFGSKFRRFKNYSYIATDESGISINSRHSSQYIYWKSIVRVALSPGFPSTWPRVQNVHPALWIIGAPFYLGLVAPLMWERLNGGVEIEVRTGDESIKINLEGHSNRHCGALLRLIADRAGLTRLHEFVYTRGAKLSSAAAAPLPSAAATDGPGPAAG